MLSKAKKLTDIKQNETKPVGFQVETADGKVREEKVEIIKKLPEEQTEPPKKKVHFILILLLIIIYIFLC